MSVVFFSVVASSSVSRHLFIFFLVSFSGSLLAGSIFRWERDEAEEAGEKESSENEDGGAAARSRGDSAGNGEAAGSSSKLSEKTTGEEEEGRTRGEEDATAGASPPPSLSPDLSLGNRESKTSYVSSSNSEDAASGDRGRTSKQENPRSSAEETESAALHQDMENKSRNPAMKEREENKSESVTMVARTNVEEAEMTKYGEDRKKKEEVDQRTEKPTDKKTQELKGFSDDEKAPRPGEEGIFLELPATFDLHDCYGHEPLPFSNYVNGFQATLDHIYASRDLQVSSFSTQTSGDPVRCIYRSTCGV